MAGTVLLRHELPDGSAHFDWMIEGGAGGLITFRVAERIDLGAAAAFEAERLADHRREYLTYEGAVAGGRGAVTRVATGELVVEVDDGVRFVARGRLGGTRGRFEGRAGPGTAWRFAFVPENVGLRG